MRQSLVSWPFPAEESQTSATSELPYLTEVVTTDASLDGGQTACYTTQRRVCRCLRERLAGDKLLTGNEFREQYVVRPWRNIRQRAT